MIQLDALNHSHALYALSGSPYAGRVDDRSDPGPETRTCLYCRKDLHYRAVAERWHHVASDAYPCGNSAGTVATPLPEGMRMRGPRTRWGQP